MGFCPSCNSVPTATGRAAALLSVAACLLLAGCVTVKPSQRKELAKPEMNPATDESESTFQVHVESAREAGFGGHGAAGGGCGCG